MWTNKQILITNEYMIVALLMFKIQIKSAIISDRKKNLLQLSREWGGRKIKLRIQKDLVQKEK